MLLPQMGIVFVQQVSRLYNLNLMPWDKDLCSSWSNPACVLFLPIVHCTCIYDGSFYPRLVV